MVEVNSTMLPLGTEAPPFSLPDPDGRRWSLDEIAAGKRGVLVVFLSNHCPFVRHLATVLGEVARDLADREVAVVGINANDVTAYPDDAPERMAEFAAANGWSFPYLFDESQEVAKAYRAACTPDFFLFDADRRLVYRGQFDDSRPGRPDPVTGADVRRAVDALLAGDPPLEEQRPSIGCNIKWRPGNEPDYFA
jgi:peroxiredoxin